MGIAGRKAKAFSPLAGLARTSVISENNGFDLVPLAALIFDPRPDPVPTELILMMDFFTSVVRFLYIRIDRAIAL